MAELKKLVIDRSKWACARTVNDGDAKLLMDTGLMCCLGFLCCALNIPKKRLLNVCMPSDLAENYTRPPKTLPVYEGGYGTWVDIDWAEKAQCANDDGGLTDSEREEQVTRALAKGGWAVEFVGSYPSLPTTEDQ